MQRKLHELAEGIEPPDDIRMFIKDEPHKPAKVEDDRLRLIMVLSLEDQVVDRILFQNWVEMEERHVLDIPGKTGWVPIPFGYRVFNRAFPSRMLATDCSSFDWTVPPWASEMLLELRMEQSPLTIDQQILISRRWEQVMGRRCVVALPDGSRFQQGTSGLMKSGWFRTIADNSDLQLLINALAWIRSHRHKRFPLMWSMGDDVALDWGDYDQKAFEEALATTGIIVKTGSERREFAGFEISLSGSVTPLYAEKHDFLLRHVTPELKQDVANSYTLLYAKAEGPFKDVIDTYVSPHSTVSPGQATMWAEGVVSAF